MENSSKTRSWIICSSRKYGASFQHLKVEIGSDANSTDGTEPSFARTHSEFVNRGKTEFDRGYEFWLMRQAKARNAGIFLDALEWGAPGWIGSIYSRNNIAYLVAFIEGAKKYHDLDMDFIGIWNERPNYTKEGTDFIINLRAALDKAGLRKVKIVGVDAIDDWTIAKLAQENPALKSALGAIGIHYPAGYGVGEVSNIGFKYKPNPIAQATGLPLFSSEDGPWDGSWNGAKTVARLNNRNYIENRMVKTEYWSPVSSYYDVLSIPGSGMMYANQPWSGHYEVQPALWAVAHTTQFAQPGWKYIDSACGLLDGDKGSYVTLKAPDGSGNYSIIVETTAMDAPQTMTFRLSHLATGQVHVWRSDATRQFVQQTPIMPSGGRFTIKLEPGAIYSLTTTTGQSKGDAVSPPAQSFPKNYSDDFTGYADGATPRYFSDQVGAFEIHKVPGQPDTLRQLLTSKPLSWIKDVLPYTMIGDQNLTDYDVTTVGRIEGDTGKIGVLGRISAVAKYEQGLEPNGYGLYLEENGTWTLRKFGATLASGTVQPAGNAWHRLELSFQGNRIDARIDGKEVAAVTDDSFSSGLAGVATGWNQAEFRSFSIHSRE